MQSIPSSSIEAVEQFYIGKDAYLTFSGATGSVTAWVFDNIAGYLVITSLLTSDFCWAGGVCKLSGFGSKGFQWMVAASTAENSDLIVYRNDSSGCSGDISCNSSWNLVQRLPANGGISSVQVF